MKIAFIGHRKIHRTQELEQNLYALIEKLISEEGADTFLFGSRSEFNELCLETVTKLKEVYPHLKRIYLRAEYEHIGEDYKQYLLSCFEETEFPASVHGAGASAYIKRNEAMIDLCDKAVFYLDENYFPKGRYSSNSGTKLAAEYARQKNKPVMNCFQSK